MFILFLTVSFARSFFVKSIKIFCVTQFSYLSENIKGNILNCQTDLASIWFEPLTDLFLQNFWMFLFFFPQVEQRGHLCDHLLRYVYNIKLTLSLKSMCAFQNVLGSRRLSKNSGKISKSVLFFLFLVYYVNLEFLP